MRCTDDEKLFWLFLWVLQFWGLLPVLSSVNYLFGLSVHNELLGGMQLTFLSQDPSTPPDALPRESVELRALVFYDE